MQVHNFVIIHIEGTTLDTLTINGYVGLLIGICYSKHVMIKGAHARVPYTISATLLTNEILAANISRYAVYAISKDRDNSNDGVRYLENAITTVWLHSNQSSLNDGKPIQIGSKLAVAVQLAITYAAQC